jgi:hypothetical protein
MARFEPMGADAALEGGEDVERLLASWQRSCPGRPGLEHHATLQAGKLPVTGNA